MVIREIGGRKSFNVGRPLRVTARPLSQICGSMIMHDIVQILEMFCQI